MGKITIPKITLTPDVILTIREAMTEGFKNFARVGILMGNRTDEEITILDISVPQQKGNHMMAEITPEGMDTARNIIAGQNLQAVGFVRYTPKFPPFISLNDALSLMKISEDLPILMLVMDDDNDYQVVFYKDEEGHTIVQSPDFELDATKTAEDNSIIPAE